MATKVRIFLVHETQIKYCFLYYLINGYRLFFLACINFDFLESRVFLFTFQIMNTETINFLTEWIYDNALSMACTLSIQTVPALSIYKRT